jgi:predicted metal-binding protein
LSLEILELDGTKRRRRMMPKQKQKTKVREFDFLLEKAKQLGALDAKIIRSDEVVVEDRVLLKCRTGCDSYGKKFVCPPFTPTLDEFRKMLKEYKKALIVKFPVEAEAEEDVGRSLQKNQYSPEIPSDLRDRTNKFWEMWSGDKRRILLSMLELEKAAFNRGYTLALSLTAGSCALCTKCNMEAKCSHPTMARYPEHALGVNVKKTLKKAGMSIKFPFERHPEGIGMLLID